MIGIFDSGIGGLTVARQVTDLLPDFDTVYLGDTAHAPYGDRTPDEICALAKADAEWLLVQGAQMIVIACHTISTLCYEMLKKKLSVPILGMVNPVVVSAMQHSRRGRIGVIGTQATINSGMYQQRIMQYATNREQEVRITAIATPTLAKLIEQNTDLETLEQTLFDITKQLQTKDIDTLILGCTHYPLVQQHIERLLGPKVVVIDPGQIMAAQAGEFLQKNSKLAKNIPKQGVHQFFVSKKTPQTDAAAAFVFGEEVQINEVSV